MSEIIKAKKAAEVEALSGSLTKAKSFLAFEYHGLTAAQMTALRADLKKQGAEVLVLKNNISRRAVEKAGFSVNEDFFVGPNAVAIAYEDELSAIKAVYEVAQEADVVKIKGGFLDGKFLTPADVNSLATIPGRDGLLSMLAQMLQSPIRSFACGVKAIADSKQ